MITPLQEWIAVKIGVPTGLFSRYDLEQYQLLKLNETINHSVKNCSFYRDKFTGVDISFQSIEQLCRFPFTFAEEIEADPNRFLCVPQDEINRIVTLPTSGTTGLSKRIFFTREDQELTIDFFHIGMSSLARPGDRVLILLPGERPDSVGDLLAKGLERLGCTPFKHGQFSDEETVLREIDDLNINVIVGSPVQYQRLVCVDEQKKITKTGQIRAVLTSTDYLPAVVIQNLQRVWGCELFDHYGMTETGLGGGVECGFHDGLHLREADLLFEIIDPVNGKVLTDGEYGEVVVTTLTRKGMPLIRYRTGDYSRIMPGECPCGSIIKRLERIHHRINGGVTFSSGEVYPADFDEALFGIDGIMDYQVAVDNMEGKKIIDLSIRLAHGELIDVEPQIVTALVQINPIAGEISAGNLNICITEMDEVKVDRPGVMKKRILNQRL